MPLTSLTDFPIEILDTIIHHCYAPWALYIHDRITNHTLPLDGPPSPSLLLVSRHISTFAQTHERRSFTRHLIFTTSSIQWRLLNRLRSISPTRLAWVIDNVETLVFCSPPLFTNRIPWVSLPSLKRIELDYCYRSANFRCQGTARELWSGSLDPLIVGFARDTERFDGPLVEDAWRAAVAMNPSMTDQVNESVDLGLKSGPSDSGGNKADARRVEVQIIKRMHVFESAAVRSSWPDDQGCSGAGRAEDWKIRVTATHRGRLQDIRFSIMSGNHEAPFGETVVWTAEKGFRDTIALDDDNAPRWELKVKGTLEREKYVCGESGALKE